MARASLVRQLRLAACLSMLGLVLAAPAGAAEVTARLDRDRLVEGETVTLILQTDDPQQSLDADLEALQRDFYVIDQRSETQMSIVNGRQSAVVRLLVTLEPKRSGRLVIPPLTLDGAQTPPLTVNVEAAPEPAPGELPPVFIETELEPVEGPYYVHAQLSLKVRIFYLQNLTEAAINPPAPEQASVRLLDEVPYQAERNGQRYRVLERRYAVFPERSGDLTIPPMQLSGRLIERPSDRLWQPSVRGRRVRVESEPIALTVSPRPAEYRGRHWLPARSVDLAQQVSDAESLRVGEPITRTVILDAVGLEEHMLEEPTWPELSDARIYPDQPQGITRDDGQWVLGHREFRYAVVPEQPGELVLPEIRLHWWDTVANRERVAVLPEHRVNVLPSVTSQAQKGGADQPSGDATGETGRAGGADLTRWQVLAALFAALWLVTLLLYLRGGRSRRRSGRERESVPAEESDLLRQLRRACREGDAAQARRVMTRWVRHFGAERPGDGMTAFAAATGDEDLVAEVQRLDASRYGPRGDAEWEGEALWRAFDAWLRNRNRGRSAGGDPDDFDLYAPAR